MRPSIPTSSPKPATGNDAMRAPDTIRNSAPLNQPLTPLPEGASYLGFIFARAKTPEAAERALRDAHARLAFRIEPAITLVAVAALVFPLTSRVADINSRLDLHMAVAAQRTTL